MSTERQVQEAPRSEAGKRARARAEARRHNPIWDVLCFSAELIVYIVLAPFRFLN